MCTEYIQYSVHTYTPTLKTSKLCPTNMTRCKFLSSLFVSENKILYRYTGFCLGWGLLEPQILLYNYTWCNYWCTYYSLYYNMRWRWNANVSYKLLIGNRYILLETIDTASLLHFLYLNFWQFSLMRSISCWIAFWQPLAFINPYPYSFYVILYLYTLTIK